MTFLLNSCFCRFRHIPSLCHIFILPIAVFPSIFLNNLTSIASTFAWVTLVKVWVSFPYFIFAVTIFYNLNICLLGDFSISSCCCFKELKILLTFPMLYYVPLFILPRYLIVVPNRLIFPCNNYNKWNSSYSIWF